MFSEKLKKYAESQYEERLGILGETGRIVEEKMSLSFEQVVPVRANAFLCASW